MLPLVLAAVGGVVPWVDRPLPLYALPPPKPIPYSTSAPPCRAAQLRVRLGRTGAGLGNQLEELVFTNVGARPCLLKGYPTITVASSGGRRALRPQRGGTYFGTLSPADLRPGGRVFLDLATGSACDGGRRPVTRHRGVVFALPGGGRLRAPRLAIAEQCGLSISEFGLPTRYAYPRPSPLRASVRVPRSVRAGTRLRYEVVLANPTAAPVALRPCPGYTEGLFSPAGGTRSSFRLNCDAVHAVPAHGRVRYEMRLAVPPRGFTGVVKLGWMLDSPAGPSAGAAVRVRGG